jgi:hypothetical protein
VRLEAAERFQAIENVSKNGPIAPPQSSSVGEVTGAFTASMTTATPLPSRGLVQAKANV